MISLFQLFFHLFPFLPSLLCSSLSSLHSFSSFLLFPSLVKQKKKEYMAENKLAPINFLLVCPSLFSPFISPNSERERMEKEVKTKTVSLWSLILSNPSDFENPLYNPATRHHVLFPLTSMRHLCLWDKYYCRWNPSMRPQVQDDGIFFCNVFWFISYIYILDTKTQVDTYKSLSLSFFWTSR